MPKKKGGKKKKDDGGGGSAAPTSSFQPLVLVPVVEEWVTLDLKLLNWNYMNFHHRCKTSTRLFQVKKILADKHGRIKDLKVCKEQFAERNEMGDEMATLASYGIKGAPQEAPHVVYTMHYDFTPVDADDPLLLFTAGPDPSAGAAPARDPLLDA